MIIPSSSTKRRCAFLALLFALPVSAASADTTTQGFLIPNAWFDETTSGDPLDPPDGVDWSFNAPWFHEPNVFSGAALFITSASNLPGFYAAEASPRDLTAQADVLELDGYDPSTTFLTDILFSDPWRVGHFGTIPTDGEYNYFIEYTIETPSGFYRAASQKLDRATAFQNTIAQTDFEFTWQDGGFLGDPFAGGGGIALDQILGQTYNVLIEVVTPTSDLDGFFNVEGFNVEYVVTSMLDTGLAGDANGDGMVDLLDLDLLGANFGLTVDPTLAEGDFNGDGAVDLLDLDILGANFGATTAAIGIPEPEAVVLVATALLGVGRRRVAIAIGIRSGDDRVV